MATPAIHSANGPPGGLGRLSPIEIHLLLALSARQHLLVSVEDSESIQHVADDVSDFCQAPNIQRSLRIIALPQDASPYDTSGDELLSSILFADAGPVTPPEPNSALEKHSYRGHTRSRVPSLLVLSRLDEYRPSVHAVLKDALRDKRFTLDGATHNLPDDFMLIGICNIGLHETISNHLIDFFGYSMLYALTTSGVPSHAVPPPIPVTPTLFISPPLRTYASDLLSALRHHPFLHGYLLTYRCTAAHVLLMAQLRAKLKAQQDRPVLAGFDSTRSISDKQVNAYEHSPAEIRPEDIQSVLGDCVRHRLRLRKVSEHLSTFWNPDQVDSVIAKRVDAIAQDSVEATLRIDEIIVEVLDSI